MRRCGIAVVVLAAVALAAAAGASPPLASVVGAGTVTFQDWPPGESTTEQIVVSAVAGPLGQGPRGTIVQHSPLGDVRADVTCLDVQGSDAIVGGTIVSGTYYGGPYAQIAFWVSDGGPGGKSDGWTGFIFRSVWPDPCARLLQVLPFFPGVAPLPLEDGAFSVIGGA